ncbi:alanine dehydrogenase [Parvularcula lutaonensis]|uniref:Alanine dehydrogenase n=1 Tax=Parvularcula lutaonensis TaxID=491923 RepID=A0ABV7MDU2_9PROT|nr:alanine dehydrogenase [Parvularcula lutaonensis]
MKIGVPKEIKKREFRVGMTPSSVREAVRCGHEVVVEKDAGAGIDLTNSDYEAAGATIVGSAEEAFDADLVVKVKEPQLQECAMLKPHQTLFTYLHLAADKPQAEALMKSGCTAIAYETVTGDHGGLPLLRPMSEVAGRMSVQVGAWALEKQQGGRGVLLGGVPGVSAANVVILGGGVSGFNAAQMAVGLHADVELFDLSLKRLEELDALFKNQVQTVFSNPTAVYEAVCRADLVIGAVLVPGAAAPKLVTREMLKDMKKGAVLVDIAIDQGGCFETSRPTTHDDPIYEVEGIVHYCVANMPGAVARTSTFALNNVTLPHVLNLANNGPVEAMRKDPHLRNGLNVMGGKITYEAVARDLGLEYQPAASFL